MYSLLSWRSVHQSTIQVIEKSEWGGREFTLSYPNSTNSPKSPTIFDLFMETENRYFPLDGEEYVVPKVTNIEDYWYRLKIESLFGYELDVEVNPSPNPFKELYELKNRIELDSACLEEMNIYSNGEEFCRFTIYPIRIHNLSSSKEFTTLASNGYLEWNTDGTVNRIDEWVFYYNENEYFTSGNLNKLIQVLLRKLLVTDSNLEIAIPKLESRWYNLSEANINTVISELKNNEELSKFANFLSN